MSRKSTIISIVCICLFAASVCVAEEHAESREIAEMREKIAHLRETANEGQAKVDRMRAEAEELEGLLRRELGEGERGREDDDRDLAEAKERMLHLREEAGAAKERGDMERAEQLWEESKHLEGELKREIEARGFGRHLEETGRKIHAMMAEAEQLERKGKQDAAHEIRAHAEKLDAELRRRHEEMRDRELGEARERMVHLREWSEEAERRGEIEKAKHLWRESEEIAGAIEREVEGREGRAREREGGREREGDELEEMEREIRHLRELAEREKAEGRHEKAEAIMGEAEELKERLIGSIEERERDDDLEEYVEEFEEAFEALRDEVNELREIVEELREKLSNR